MLAAPPLKERFHDEGTFVDEDFCGAGLTVDGTFVVDGRLLVVPHGPDGLAYFLEHVTANIEFTNRASGKTVTLNSTRRQPRSANDRQRRRHADDSLPCEPATRSSTEPTARRSARSCRGQIRLEVLIDHAGTPTDPSDDVFLSEELVKGSTGRTGREFCETAVAALS